MCHQCHQNFWSQQRLWRLLFKMSVWPLLSVVLMTGGISRAQDLPGGPPKPIPLNEAPLPPLKERLQRRISLDVREMAVIDVLKFLALKGEFNLVTSGTIQGRATFYLKNVSIKDALDIAVLTNRLAYAIDNNIVHVMSEQEYQALYGKPFNDKNIVEIVRLHYAKPSYVLTTLESLKSALGRVIIDEETGTVVMIDTPDSIRQMKQAIERIEDPTETVVYTLQYAKAAEIAEQLRARLESQGVGTVQVDERTNKVIVKAYKDRRSEVEAILHELDEPTKEVLVEVRVLQVTLNPKLDVGIDWDADFKTSEHASLRNLHFQNVFLDESNLTSSDNLFSKYAKIAVGDFNVDTFQAAIRALKQVSDTKILSNPRILVTNNEEARIHVGDTVPYIVSTTSGTGENAITSEEVRFVDVGVKLSVTPTINDDGYVTMALNPEISTIVGKISSQGGGIPQVSKTEVQTTVMVKDGETIVLGGLKKDNKVLTRKGVPLLMDVPVIKHLFSSTSESIESTEIVIFITPKIKTGSADYAGPESLIKADRVLNRDKEVVPQAQLKLKD